MNNLAGRSVFTVALLFVAIPGLFAQVEITGRVAGVVTDATGALIPGVAVTISGPTLFQPRALLSSENGSYFVDRLPLGDYKVTFVFPGFKVAQQEGVNVRAGFTATINVALEVGSAEQTMIVMETAPVVDVRTATQATTFDADLLKDVPTGRDTWSTLATVPGLTPSKFDVGGTESFQQTGTGVHGSTGQAAYNVNGLNLNWPGGSGGSTAFYFDNDGFEEIQVVTDAAQAETMVGGVQINMITKQGTNQVHGSILGYYTTAGLTSNPNYPLFNGTGIESGTKITMMRDTTVQMGFPIVKNRLWWFSGYRRYDINLAVPAIKRPDGSAIKDNNHQSNLNARLDISATERQKVNLNWLYNSINRFYRRGSGFVDDVASGVQIEPAWIGQGQYTYMPTANLVLETRFGNMTLHFPQDYQPEVLPGTIAVTDSVLNTTKYARPGGRTINSTWHVRGTQNVSYFKTGWMADSHNIRGGFEYAQLSNGNVAVIYRDTTVTLANGEPLRATLHNTPRSSRERTNETAAFVQDSVVIGRLTINGGFRYDRFLGFLPPQKSPAGTWVGERSYARSGNLVVFNDFSPRISVAFDPSGRGRSVIRASYSRFVDLEGTSLASSVNPNAAASINATFTSLAPDNFPLGITIQPAFQEGGQFRRLDPNLKRSTTRQITAGFEKQFLGDIRASAGYFFRDAHNYRTSFNRALTPDDYTPLSVTNPYTGEPLTIYNLNANRLTLNPDTFVTNAIEDPDNAYHGLEFSASKRMSKNWQMLAGYTLQRKTGDSVPNPGNPNADIFSTGNVIGNDSTHVFKLSGSYLAPLKINISANFQHYTGYPFTPSALFQRGANAAGTLVNLNQTSVTLPLIRRGDERLPDLNTLNIRFGHVRSIAESIKVQPSVDLYNVFNKNTVTSMIETIGPNFRRPETIISQRFVRFGLRIDF